MSQQIAALQSVLVCEVCGTEIAQSGLVDLNGRWLDPDDPFADRRHVVGTPVPMEERTTLLKFMKHHDTTGHAKAAKHERLTLATV